MVLQLGSYLSYVYDNSNQYSVTCKEVLLKDKSESNKVVFEKLDSWLKVYPKYSTNCNLGEQLTQMCIRDRFYTLRLFTQRR